MADRPIPSARKARVAVDRRTYDFADLKALPDDLPEEMLRALLCDDSPSDNTYAQLVRPGFKPDSFVVDERSASPPFLSEMERDAWHVVASDIRAKLDMLRAEGVVLLPEPEPFVARIAEQAVKLLQYRVGDMPVGALLYNQELTDVLRRVMSFCLTGEIDHDVPTHEYMNTIGKQLMPIILDRYLVDRDDLKYLLMYSIASGLIALDLKGAAAAASPISSAGIPLRPWLDAGVSVSRMADAVHEQIEEVVADGLAIDYWDEFSSEVVNGCACRLAWLTDDVIETIPDLLLAQKLLRQNPNLQITMIPKNGAHGNDASYIDVLEMLQQHACRNLLDELACGRFRVVGRGPRMGTVNLRKLSREAGEELLASDVVYVKGCRGHEMMQGGVNRITYTSFAVAREFTETETGLDARSTPLVFFRSAPSEYAYWGFKGRATRYKEFPDGRRIGIAYSTLEEHEFRKRTTDPEAIVAELQRMVALYPSVSCSEYRTAYDEETMCTVDTLSEITRCAYNRKAYDYASVRRDKPSDKDARVMDELLLMARARVKEGKLGDLEGRITILDVGTAHGRHLRYLNRYNDVRAIGIDNASNFIRMLADLAHSGAISAGSFREMDMRHLSGFAEASFDVVRHNATLLHLPVLPNGIGADEALAESFRVLKPHGLLYVSVKAGAGLACEDTGEGLGKRVHQYYSRRSLCELLQRNGFNVIEVRMRHTTTPSGRVAWLLCFAEKSRPVR